MSAEQLLSFKDYNIKDFKEYLDKIKEIQSTNFDFDREPLYAYADAIEGLGNSQAALLLHTQGLTNAKIKETLAIKGLTVQEQYQAMTEAGLLKTKKRLTSAEIQENLQTVLGENADVKATMAAMKLTKETNKLTSAKLKLAVQEKVLTKEQAEHLGILSGVSVATVKNTSAMPAWIAGLKASATAIGKQTVATAKWLLTNPVGWITAAVAAYFSLNKAIQSHIDTLEDQKGALEEIKESISGYESEKILGE